MGSARSRTRSPELCSHTLRTSRPPSWLPVFCNLPDTYLGIIRMGCRERGVRKARSPNGTLFRSRPPRSPELSSRTLRILRPPFWLSVLCISPDTYHGHHPNGLPRAWCPKAKGMVRPGRLRRTLHQCV